MERRRNRVGDSRSRRARARLDGQRRRYCIRTPTQPLMAIRPPEHGPDGVERPLARNQVVVPLDGSPLAEAALPYDAVLGGAPSTWRGVLQPDP